MTATGGGTYAWSGPDGFTATSQNPTIVGMTSAKAGVYTVTVTLGGYTSTATTTVSVYTAPTITAASNTPVPTGQTIQLTANSTPIYSSYAWSGPNTFSSNAQNPTVASVSAAAGTYIVTVTDENGCTATASRYLTTCVWSGDTDTSGVVNAADLLNIGLAFGERGAARPSCQVDSFSNTYCTNGQANNVPFGRNKQQRAST